MLDVSRTWRLVRLIAVNLLECNRRQFGFGNTEGNLPRQTISVNRYFRGLIVHATPAGKGSIRGNQTSNEFKS